MDPDAGKQRMEERPVWYRILEVLTNVLHRHFLAVPRSFRTGKRVDRRAMPWHPPKTKAYPAHSRCYPCQNPRHRRMEAKRYNELGCQREITAIIVWTRLWYKIRIKVEGFCALCDHRFIHYRQR